MSGETSIIIGIDFGTTYSGVSWALTTGNKEVRVINDWPNQHGAIGNQDKVPSKISYNANGTVAKWGYKVGTNDDAFKWIKIMLDPSHKYFAEMQERREISLRLERARKTAEDVVTDYLKCVWDYTIDHLKRKKGPDFQSVYTVKVVLTVPAVWSALAKDKTLRAAKRAGIPAATKLVTEPEAAALALLKQKSEEHSIKVGDGLVVCDAGGGTVDLISYKVESLSPLRVRECVMGDGDLCGSVFLDIAFRKHIRMLVGAEQYDSIRDRYKEKMMEHFESGIKRSFTKEDSGNLSVDLKGVEDDEENGIDDEIITIPTNALRAIFDSICLKIQDLIEKQLIGVRNKGITTRTIGLVGGFGESKYLFEYLKTANVNAGVKVLQEPGAISAVCRGATLWGLEQNHATSFLSRIARSSYGIVYMKPWNASDPNHHPSDKIWDASKSRWMASGQMTWLLKRGEEVVEGHTIQGSGINSVELLPSDRGDWYHEGVLYYSNADVPPGRQEDIRVRELCRISYTIPYSEIRKKPAYNNEGKVWRDVSTSRDIICGGAALEFRVMHDKKLLKSVEANYVEDL